MAVAYLVTDPTPSPGQRPCFLPPLGLLRRRALRSALRFASLQTSLHGRYIPRYRPNPQPGPVTLLFAAAWFALNRAAEACFACCALLCLVTDLKPSRYIPRYRPNPSPGQRPPFLPQLGLRELRGRALRPGLCFASLPSSLHSHHILRSAALHCAADTACQEMIVPLQTCVTRTSVTDLRNKIRGASRVTDP